MNSQWHTILFLLSSPAYAAPLIKPLSTAPTLHDLTNDPDELINVVHDPGYQEARRQLMKEMMHRVMLQEFPLPPRDLLVIGAH
ncbi:MAG: hypothetical protein QF437_20260 [Planctomycetota bacterium]|jgi:hypothetical protein|nr:hypothetical protein [Planctomycetota bacterium]MDP7132840.1 hypothetical protein [Planctomycetota bacterium]MDP7251867.1 hypothetical protein [Planctomycetota bacterium]